MSTDLEIDNMRKMMVADFFCGAGGFSEGFRQKGFEIAFALDNWRPAIETHALNHPGCVHEYGDLGMSTCKHNIGCKHMLMNILLLDTPEKIDSIVPDVDIIIGSPPCVAFSGSNKAGKADKSLGVKLIKAYLKIIAWKKSKGTLKYWILENVPNSSKHIKENYTWQELGLPGKGPELKIPQRTILNAAQYGAPQTRNRFVCGDYLLPEKTHDELSYIHMSDIFNSLGNPTERKKKEIADPSYGFKIASSNLTDHYYDTLVSPFEWKRAKRLKEDHGFMGKMSFPENLNRPSRTVMATMSASTRESMIFLAEDKKSSSENYRLPTIREIASFMSFPITYQFEASSESTKYRLVGNAVCPKLSAALAKSIAKKESLNIPSRVLHETIIPPKVNLNGTKRATKQPGLRNPHAKFAQHVPTLKVNTFRVELNNTESDFTKNKIKWNCVLHQGTGSRALKSNILVADIEPIISSLTGFGKFKDQVIGAFKGKTSAKALQEEYCLNDDSVGPMHALNQIKNIVDTYFPENKFNSMNLTNSNKQIKLNRSSIPSRIALAAYACAQLTARLK